MSLKRVGSAFMKHVRAAHALASAREAWPGRGSWAVAASLLLLAAHAALFFWICDDAFISFRYAAQLLEGNGLVFNAGERVEGYTNFLWVLEVALLGALGVPMAAASVVLSAAATLGTLWLTVQLAKSTPFPSTRPLVSIAALLLLATNRNFAMWTTSGLETRQFTFLVLLAIWLARRAASGSSSWISVSLALAATELTRPEGALVAVSVGAWALWQLWAREQPRARPLLELILPCAAIVAAHYIGRRLYYGDWLPNTAYAKVVRPWPDAGIVYYGAAALQNGLYLIVPLALLGGWLRWLRRRDTLLALSAFVILPHALYIVVIGGDHFEFRPLDFYWPLLAVGASDALGGLALLLRRALGRARLWQPRGLSRALWGAALGMVLAYAGVLQLAQFIAEYPRRSKRDLAPEAPPVVSAESFPLGMVLPFFESLAKAYQSSLATLTSHAIAVSWIEHRGFQATLLPMYGPYGAAPRELFPPSAVMAHQWMGILPFHLREVTFIDKFGLTDRTIARHGAPKNERRHMAHDRSPPPGYLESRGVNITIQPAARTLEGALEQASYSVRLASDLWAPFESPRPDWVETAFREHAWYRPDWARPERSVLAGRRVTQVRQLLDCESDTSAWQLGSAACVRSPGKDEGRVLGYEGAAWLSTYGARAGDSVVTEVRSPLIDLGPNAYLIFKLAGGSQPALRFALLDESGRELAAFRGRNDQQLRPHVLDLATYGARSMRVALSDQSREGWGHLLLDALAVVELEAAAGTGAAAASTRGGATSTAGL